MKKKKLVACMCITAVSLMAAVTGGSIFLVNYALRPERAGMDVQAAISKVCRDYPFITSWADSLQANGALRDTVINAPDGTPLHAYYVYSSRPHGRRLSWYTVTGTVPSTCSPSDSCTTVRSTAISCYPT